MPQKRKRTDNEDRVESQRAYHDVIRPLSQPTIDIGPLSTGNLFPSLSASEAVVTDASKNLISYPYTTTRTASTIVARDGVGSSDFNSITASQVTVDATGSFQNSHAIYAAAGTTFGTATLLTTNICVVSSADASNTGVKVASLGFGTQYNVINQSSQTIKVYPRDITTQQIDSLGIGIPYQIAAGAQQVFTIFSATQVYSGNGTVGGSTTIKGTTNQVTTSTDSFGVVTLGTPQNIGTLSTPTFTGLTLTGLSVSKVVGTDGSNNLTSLGLDTNNTPNTIVQRDAFGSFSAQNTTFNEVQVSTLSASSLVATDGSKVLSSTTSALTPTFTGLNLSGLTASQAVVSDGSNNLASLAYTDVCSASTIMSRDGTGCSRYHRPINTQSLGSTGTYTLVLTDSGKFIYMSASTSCTLTIPQNVNVAFDIGTEIDVFQNSTGPVTISGGGVSITSPYGNQPIKSNGAGSQIRIKKIATDTWVCSGDIFQVIFNAVTFTPSGLGSQIALDHNTIDSNTITFVANGGNSASTTVAMIKTGSFIHVSVPITTWTSSTTPAAAITTTGGLILTGYRPSATIRIPILVEDNGANSIGLFEIASTGAIKAYKDATTTTNFTNSTTVGFPSGVEITYKL